MTSCRGSLLGKKNQCHSNHLSNLASEINSKQVDIHHENKVCEEEYKAKKFGTESNLLKHISSSTEKQESVSNYLNSHAPNKTANAGNINCSEIVENENFIKPKEISNSIVENTEWSNKKAKKTNEDNRGFKKKISTYRIRNGEVTNGSTNTCSIRHCNDNFLCNNEFKNSTCNMLQEDIQPSFIDTITNFPSPLQQHEIENKVVNGNEKLINNKSRAVFMDKQESAIEECATTESFSTFSRDMSISESSVLLESVDDSFITKRKRRRVRKRKHRQPNLVDQNEVEIPSYMSHKMEAAPVTHIKFSDQDLSDEVDEDRIDSLNNVSCESSILKEQSMVDLTIDENCVIEEDRLLKYPIMTDVVPRKGDIVSFKVSTNK